MDLPSAYKKLIKTYKPLQPTQERKMRHKKLKVSAGYDFHVFFVLPC